MKTLIENTIHPQGLGTPHNITIFNTDDPKKPRYYNIAKLSGRILWVKYHYDKDNIVYKDGLTLVSIPQELDEAGVRQYIIDTINNQL